MVRARDVQLFYIDLETGEIKRLGGDTRFETLLKQVKAERVAFTINYAPCVIASMIVDRDPNAPILARLAPGNVCPSCGGRHVLELRLIEIPFWQNGTMYTHEADCHDTGDVMLVGLRGNNGKEE